jgi:hypothetical protein
MAAQIKGLPFGVLIPLSHWTARLWRGREGRGGKEAGFYRQAIYVPDPSRNTK